MAKRARGFSMVEMLIVLVVLAGLIAAILFTYQRIRSGRQVLHLVEQVQLIDQAIAHAYPPEKRADGNLYAGISMAALQAYENASLNPLPGGNFISPYGGGWNLFQRDYWGVAGSGYMIEYSMVPVEDCVTLSGLLDKEFDEILVFDQLHYNVIKTFGSPTTTTNTIAACNGQQNGDPRPAWVYFFLGKA